MALETASEITASHIPDYTIFAARHGELGCAVRLLKDIATGTPLSPMYFVQSVHNTAAGLFTISHRLTHNVTAMAAGARTFSAAILEMLSWLGSNPDQKVLVVWYDDYIPEAYAPLQIPGSHRYALAILFSSARPPSGSTQQQTITIHYDDDIHGEPSAQPSPAQLPEPLGFLAWLLAPGSESWHSRHGSHTLYFTCSRPEQP